MLSNLLVTQVATNHLRTSSRRETVLFCFLFACDGSVLRFCDDVWSLTPHRGSVQHLHRTSCKLHVEGVNLATHVYPPRAPIVSRLYPQSIILPCFAFTHESQREGLKESLWNIVHVCDLDYTSDYVHIKEAQLIRI